MKKYTQTIARNDYYRKKIISYIKQSEQERDDLLERIFELFELSMLHKLSKTISYNLDYHELLRLIMDSLGKIICCDVCSLLLFNSKVSGLMLRATNRVGDGFVQHVKSNIVNASSALIGKSIDQKQVSVNFRRHKTSNDGGKMKQGKLRSFFSVPMYTNSKVIGTLSAGSIEPEAFNDSSISLMYKIANRVAFTVEKLQTVIDAERSKLQSMVEHMVDGIIILDENGEIIVFNSVATDMLNIKQDDYRAYEYLRERFKDLRSHGSSIPELNGLSNRTMPNPIVMVEPYKQSLNVNLGDVTNAESKKIGTIVTIRTVTGQQREDRMKTDFISTVSHELRTPLCITKEGISLVLEGVAGTINEKQKEILDTASENIDRLVRIIDDLLDIAKIEAGKVVLKRELVDVTTLAGKVCANWKIQAHKKEQQFIYSVPSEPINMYVDGDKIVQILNNLISNAIKFTPNRGRIDVILKDFKHKVKIVVSDNGIGIPEDDLPRTFGKFEQFKRLPGPGAKGTGLGLAITKKLVEMHDGKIQVKSQIKKGTKFTVSLPKLDIKTIFQGHIKNGIKKADERGTSLSVNLVQIKGIEKDCKKSVVHNAVYSDITRIVTNSLHRVTEILVGADNNDILVLILLSEVEKLDILAMGGHISRAIRNYLSRQGDSVKDTKVLFGTATYPDDVISEDELLEKAMNSPQLGGR